MGHVNLISKALYFYFFNQGLSLANFLSFLIFQMRFLFEYYNITYDVLSIFILIFLSIYSFHVCLKKILGF